MNLSLKSSIIHHGNYIDVYPTPNKSEAIIKEELKIPQGSILLTYIGAIRPYKGLEKLITAFNQLEAANIYLLIAGKAMPSNYKDDILKKINEHDRIKTNFSFLNDQDLVNYLSASNVMCIPFSDTLTSGSTILAMSHSLPLILPNNAKVFGCVPKGGVQYFNTIEELTAILNKLELEHLNTSGEKNYTKAKEMDWSSVARLTIRCYLQ